MKVPFEWEMVGDKSHYDGNIETVTVRAKVKGGWVLSIYNFILSKSHIDGELECVGCDSSMTFIPDSKHEWEIEL